MQRLMKILGAVLLPCLLPWIATADARQPAVERAPEVQNPIEVTGEIHHYGGRGQILKDVELIEEGKQRYNLNVHFNMFIRYDWDSPGKATDEITIKITPTQVNRGDDEAVTRRDTILAGDDKDLPLDEVVYDGRSEGGPYLIVRLNRRHHYTALKNADYRSLSIQLD